MKQKLFLLIAAFSLFGNSLRADEGMWLLPLIGQLNYPAMKDMGLQLTPEQIYNINNSSLKDAIVIFGNGCTGEIVSDDGLLFTNHHCGFDQIQNHSSVEHDYIIDGFWAYKRSDELPNPGLTVTFLIRIEDVTQQIMKDITGTMSEAERNDSIDSAVNRIEQKAIEGTTYTATVESMFEGNQFFLFIYEVYPDVRLVGAPPASIGNFGDETDNWMWPRHTGDFSIFRVYSGPDGKPAEYSPDNVPLKPNYHLPISLEGVKKDDFTMIMGYPGSTERYISSWGVKEMYEISNPVRIKIRGIRQDILKKEMLADESISIKYASKYARSSNYWKYSIGQNKGIDRLAIIEEKEEEETDFTNWVNADSSRNKIYGTVLNDIQEYYKIRREPYNNLQMMTEAFVRGIELFSLAAECMDLAVNMSIGADAENLQDNIEQLKKSADEFYKEYDAEIDKKVAKGLIKAYLESVPAERRPLFCSVITKKYNGNIDKYVDDVFKKSFFASREKLNEFLNNPSLRALKKDPAFFAANSVIVKRSEERAIYSQKRDAYNKALRLYLKGRMEMNQNKTFYPDANFTMRLTYGSVKDYSPADAVQYHYYTTLKGVMEKEDATNPEFIVSDKLKELYNDNDFGKYGSHGVMPVCYTTTNDITGGNSGSPVLNGKGELIGLAFDGNWEAMSGDIVFENEIQRCICVDIRYVLFVIDKFAGATNLIEELTIVE